MNWKFWVGVGILIFLALAYLIEVPVESGTGYLVYSSILGIIIFYNPFVLALYILIAVVLIVVGLKKKKK